MHRLSSIGQLAGHLRPIAEGAYEDFVYNRVYRHSAYWAAGAINDSLDRLHRGHLGDAMRSHSLFRVPSD